MTWLDRLFCWMGWHDPWRVEFMWSQREGYAERCRDCGRVWFNDDQLGRLPWP